jgi:hypothetical protein
LIRLHDYDSDQENVELDLWSHHRLCTGCGHIALPIVLIGAPLMAAACGSLLGPPL